METVVTSYVSTRFIQHHISSSSATEASPTSYLFFLSPENSPCHTSCLASMITALTVNNSSFRHYRWWFFVFTLVQWLVFGQFWRFLPGYSMPNLLLASHLVSSGKLVFDAFPYTLLPRINHRLNSCASHLARCAHTRELTMSWYPCWCMDVFRFVCSTGYRSSRHERNLPRGIQWQCRGSAELRTLKRNTWIIKFPSWPLYCLTWATHIFDTCA